MSQTEHNDTDQQKRRPGRPRLDAEMVPRILDAAERLFAKRGILSVSIRDIAAEAGMPHSAIYRYFEGKDDVVREVLIRGRTRQQEREAARRASGQALDGALDWFMTTNRGYVLATARAAMDGETPTSLGIDPTVSTARRSLRVLTQDEYQFEVTRGIDPSIAVAAAMAMAFGWAIFEDWIVESVGLEGRPIAEVRSTLDTVMGSIMALGTQPGP